MMKMYRYHQNNSGGLHVDMPNIHPVHGFVDGWDLYVYAETMMEADTTAQEHGIYFDGVREGTDCSCCGDRWHATWGEESEEAAQSMVPEILMYEKQFWVD
jgi:hypothetical protein